jgi:hypothetical protein
MKANFELVTELQTLHRRDFPLADPTILNPLNSNPLLDGEWLEMNSSYALARGAAGVGGTNEGDNAAVFPIHTERGRYDTQAIGRTNVLMLGMYEADTLVITSAGLVVGDALTVQNVTYLGGTKRGLAKKVAAASGVVVVGFVTKIVGSKVRFVHLANQKVF